MVWTRERKILALIMTVAVGLLIIDRISAGPEAADGASSPTPTAETTAETSGQKSSSSAEKTPAPANGRPVARLLSEVRAGHDFDIERIGNAFTPSEQWDDGDTPSGGGDDRSDAQAFAESHRVTAVMRGERGHYAIINGEIVRIGRKIDGFTLLEVKQDAVVFRSRRWEVELPLDDTRP